MSSKNQNKSKKASRLHSGSSIRLSKKSGKLHSELRNLQVCTACKPATEAKYLLRPSPSCHAEDCAGMMLIGNDKRIYLSQPDARRIYKWVPMVTSAEIRFPKSVSNVVYTHDNGSRPFRVTISKGGKQLDIAKCIYPEWRKVPKAYEDARYYQHLVTYKVRRVLLGDDPENVYGERPEWVKDWRGNTILAELAPNRYLFIGESVFEFQTSGKSPITMYRSPVGNNDVPYPFAVDSEYVYLFAYDYKVPVSDVDFKAKPFDPYNTSYNKSTMPKIVKKVIIPRE